MTGLEIVLLLTVGVVWLAGHIALSDMKRQLDDKKAQNFDLYMQVASLQYELEKIRGTWGPPIGPEPTGEG